MRKRLVVQELDSESTIIVDGPASVNLSRGEASSLGAPLNSNVWSGLHRDQRLTIETNSRCSIDIRLGKGGRSERFAGSTIPVGWKEASQLSLSAPGALVILGDVDSGKSTLSTYLANQLSRQGGSLSVIDGDVGQADIGPPTTISIARLHDPVFDLQSLHPETSLFIGDTSPSIVSEKVLNGLARLRDIAIKDSNLVIVNTDGWVSGEEAFRYKKQLVESIRPNLVIGIDVAGELGKLLDWPDCTVLRLGKSAFARTKSREERKRAREFGYQRFLRGARPVNYSLHDLKLRRYDSYHQLMIHGRENLRGLIAGLLDENELLQSVARVEGLRNDVLRLWTVPAGTPRTVELGSVILSSKYTELGYDV